jgi:hypothetical protein
MKIQIESETYWEMNAEKLRAEVERRNRFSEKCLKLTTYDQETKIENLKNIERWNSYIRFEKEKYEEKIKYFEEYIKMAKAKNEEIEKKEKEYAETKKNFDFVSKCIEKRAIKMDGGCIQHGN